MMIPNAVIKRCKPEVWIIVLILVVTLFPGVAVAQPQDSRFELGFHFAGQSVSEFDTTDAGLGGRVTYNVSPLIGLEAELNLYPGDLTDQNPFSGSRTEGLFGVKVNVPLLGKVKAFGKARPGFLRFGEAPDVLACIAIYPPPLECSLASGSTALALELGGGVELSTSARSFVRFDVGDNLVRYDVGPALRPKEGIVNGPFWTSNFRFTFGGGFRF